MPTKGSPVVGSPRTEMNVEPGSRRERVEELHTGRQRSGGAGFTAAPAQPCSVAARPALAFSGPAASRPAPAMICGSSYIEVLSRVSLVWEIAWSLVRGETTQPFPLSISLCHHS